VTTSVSWMRQREQAAGAGKQEIQQYQRSRASRELKGTLCNIVERCSQAEELFERLYGVERTFWGAASTTMR